MYHFMDHKETIEMLRKSGCNHGEIDKLTRFRKRFVHGDKDRTEDEHRRLEFARWLFRTGKLNDFAN